jgi:hypothetical protein
MISPVTCGNDRLLPRFVLKPIGLLGLLSCLHGKMEEHVIVAT